MSKLSILNSLEIKEGDERVQIYDKAEQATNETHAIVLLTEWDEFRELDFKNIFSQMQKPAYFFDGRNHIDSTIIKEAGFRLFRIGKN